jgi:hypothetical protein
MENESAQQPNLDQDQHDKWLASRSREQISRLASRAAQAARSAEQSGRLSSKSGQPEVRSEEVRASPLEDIFANLNKRGLARTEAEVAYTARPDGAQIKYVQENFLDILSELEDSDLVKINCD